MSGAETVLAVHGLSASFASTLVFDSVSFELVMGDWMWVGGGNGAGKTVLCDMVCGFTRPKSGVIYIKGQDVSESVGWIRMKRWIGRVYQENRLPWRLDVGEFIAFSQARRVSEPLPQSVDLEDLLAGLPIQQLWSRSCGELSGGEARLVSIAAAVVRLPSLLVLDEPFAGLTKAASECVVLTVDKLRAAGAAVLLVEHRRSSELGVSGLVSNFQCGPLRFSKQESSDASGS